ncbi:hypothetical protein [Microbacterium sp.]|uniref:hypothetical protein n=1 Tax=Microbacterium sp. TaxID=51671 RepID=UPI003221EC89
MKKVLSACLAAVLLAGGLALTSTAAYADDSGSAGLPSEQAVEQTDANAGETAGDDQGGGDAVEQTGATDETGATDGQSSGDTGDTGEVSESVDTGAQTESATTFTAPETTVQTFGSQHKPSKPEKPSKKPAKPDAIVTYGEWEKTDVDCVKGVETYTRTVTTQDWTWSDHKKKWVKGEVTETTETKECDVKPGQCVPEKPEPVVTYGKWKKTSVDCELGIETYTRTVYTQDWKWSDHKKKWVKGEVTETTETKECEIKPGVCPPEKPEPVVTYGEWEVTAVDCTVKTQTLTRTVTTQDWKWSDHKKKWIPGEVTETTETETTEATPEQCPDPDEIVPVAPSVSSATAVCDDGQVIRGTGTITLPAIANASWEGTESGTITDVDPGEYTFRLIADEGFVIADANGFVDGVVTVTVADAGTPDCAVPTTPVDPGTPAKPASVAKLAVTGGSVAPWLLPAGALALLAGLAATIRSARASRR